MTAVLYGLDRWLEKRGKNVRIVSYYLVVQPVPPSATEPAGITIREATPDDPVLARFPLDSDVLAYRFGQGATCLAVWRRDALLGCFWLRDGDYLEDEVRCRFVPVPADRTIWDFDVYLLPEHRLGRGFFQLWHAVFGYLRARDKAWSTSRISAFNSRSLASHKALGARIVGRAVFITGRQWQLMLASRSPFVHFSRRPEQRPTLRVGPPRVS